MEETVIVIMMKEKQTGFLEKELVSCVIKKHDALLLNAFATNDEDNILIKLRVTCETDVLDWQFDAIFDYYDSDIYESEDVSCHEVEGCFNPTWELSFVYDEKTVETKINKLLEMHSNELLDVFESIKDEAEHYSDL